MKSPIAQELGRKGGLKTLERHGLRHYFKMAKKATEARKLSTSKRKKNLHRLAVGDKVKK